MYICIDSYGIYCKRQKSERKVSWLNEFHLKCTEKPLVALKLLKKAFYNIVQLNIHWENLRDSSKNCKSFLLFNF